VPAGELLNGQHEKETAIALPYEIMVTDVTNAQFARYLNVALGRGAVKLEGDRIVGYYPGDTFHGHKHEDKVEASDWLHVPLSDPSLRLAYDGRSFDVKQGYKNHPMTVVTWFGAKAYCGFRGWRLPSEVEWEKAARGTDNRAFPWGETIEGNSANFYASRDPFEAVAGKQGDTTPVGFYNGWVYNGIPT
jgi:formylglycine-generating enzyme required for sulfatase activity